MGYLDPSVCWFCGGRKKNKERSVQKNRRTGKWEVKQLPTPVNSALLKRVYGYHTVHEYCLAKHVARKMWTTEWDRAKAQEMADVYGIPIATIDVAFQLLVAEKQRARYGKKTK